MRDNNTEDFKHSFNNCLYQLTFFENKELLAEICFKIIPIILSGWITTLIIAHYLQVEFSLFDPLYPIKDVAKESYGQLQWLFRIALLFSTLPYFGAFAVGFFMFLDTKEVFYLLKGIIPLLYTLGYVIFFFFVSCLMTIILM